MPDPNNNLIPNPNEFFVFAVADLDLAAASSSSARVVKRRSGRRFSLVQIAGGGERAEAGSRRRGAYVVAQPSRYALQVLVTEKIEHLNDPFEITVLREAESAGKMNVEAIIRIAVEHARGDRCQSQASAVCVHRRQAQVAVPLIARSPRAPVSLLPIGIEVSREGAKRNRGFGGPDDPQREFQRQVDDSRSHEHMAAVDITRTPIEIRVCVVRNRVLGIVIRCERESV